jgi:hypothetical protein
MLGVFRDTKFTVELISFTVFQTNEVGVAVACIYEVLGSNLRWTPTILRCFFLILDCETIGTAATLGLLCQPRVIMKMIVEKQME